ncbi:Hypothetical predicted protein [Mytilus galloprovincialis]|uniref:Peptidase S8/S53 domain-containing protein n=1 Tax=Mytilus galloprovincialis TaxID=29158 RepID=A0A8B6DUQ3_MYTGA|nr:Hypothetical predicted protein [Mytilus galloprovincialis]
MLVPVTVANVGSCYLECWFLLLRIFVPVAVNVGSCYCECGFQLLRMLIPVTANVGSCYCECGFLLLRMLVPVTANVGSCYCECWFLLLRMLVPVIANIKWVQQEIGHVRVPRTVDTEWSNLWYLNDDVTPTMKVGNAWSAGYTGAGIVIAVLDDGLQTDHPDLAANVDTANDKDIYGFDNDPKPTPGKR